MIQETLWNVMRHGGAREASLRMGIVDGRLSIMVADLGSGFHEPPPLGGPRFS